MLRDRLGDGLVKALRALDGKPRFRALTARARVLPEVFIIGAPRCGTTALWAQLAKHPSVVVRRKKEIFFWGSPPGTEDHWERGLAWYKGWFPTRLEMSEVARRAGGRAVSIDATPTYLYSEEAARRLRRTAWGAKIIILLRDPVDRAVSDHNLERSHFHRETLPLEEAVRLDAERAKGDYRHAYVSMGVYLPHVRVWMSAFPDEQCLVLPSEELFARPRETLDRVHRFLELSPFDAGELKKANSFRYAERPTPALREELAATFRPHNEALYEYLERDLGWTGGV